METRSGVRRKSKTGHFSCLKIGVQARQGDEQPPQGQTVEHEGVHSWRRGRQKQEAEIDCKNQRLPVGASIESPDILRTGFFRGIFFSDDGNSTGPAAAHDEGQAVPGDARRAFIYDHLPQESINSFRTVPLRNPCRVEFGALATLIMKKL